MSGLADTEFEELMASGERLGAAERAKIDAEGAFIKVREAARPSIRFTPFLWPVIGIAAAVLIITGIKYFPSKPLESKTYSTIPGQRATITLADGSQAVLAPATRMIVAGRTAELAGEAVFTVNQHKGNPFIVKAGNTTTRVLGTTFGIRAYDKTIQIAVSDGKVAVASYTLTAGNVAIVTDTSSQILYNANVVEWMAWTKGQLVFRNALVSDVLAQLERWYDLKIEVADPELNDRHINTTVAGNTLTDEELGGLAAAIGARVKRSDRKIIFHSINR